MAGGVLRDGTSGDAGEGASAPAAQRATLLYCCGARARAGDIVSGVWRCPACRCAWNHCRGTFDGLVEQEADVGRAEITVHDESAATPSGRDNSVCGGRCAAALITTNGIKQCRKGCISTESSPHQNPWHWCNGDHDYPPFHPDTQVLGESQQPATPGTWNPSFVAVTQRSPPCREPPSCALPCNRDYRRGPRFCGELCTRPACHDEAGEHWCGRCGFQTTALAGPISTMVGTWGDLSSTVSTSPALWG